MARSRREAGLLAIAAAVAAVVTMALAPAAVGRRLDGSRGPDRLGGSRGPDLIRAGRGNDRVSGGLGNDRLFGASGNDRMSGGRGNDSMSGGSGNDRMYGDSGNDRMSGGTGNDRVSGGSGRDRLLCGRGRDVAVGGRGDRISRDCETILDARTGRRIRRARDIEGSQPPGSRPPGKACHTEIRTVLVQKGPGINAPFVLEPQVVLICGTGRGRPGAPQCSDGRDNDGDAAVDYPRDRGCSSASDDREYPDPVSPAEQLLTSRNGFWYVLADGNAGGSAACSLYVFRLTPQGDRIGSRQDWFPNPFTGACLLQTTSGVPQTFTWSTTGFPAPKVPAPYTPMGTRVRLHYSGGATVLLWLFARDASRDLLVYSVNKSPTEAGSAAIGLWGCSSPNFPAVLQPPGCG